jgi:hypothetical protein
MIEWLLAGVVLGWLLSRGREPPRPAPAGRSF